MVSFKDFIIERFYDVARRKNNWTDLSNNPIAKNDLPLKQNLFDLVDFAYKKSLGEPNYGVKSVNDVFGTDYNYWEAIDIDEDPNAEAVIFGKKRFGVKISGIGHDGEMLSKKALVKGLVDQLHRKGYWLEASHTLAEILKLKGVPTIRDTRLVENLFPGSKIVQQFPDNGYIRTISDQSIRQTVVTAKEYLFGNPLI